MRSHVGASLCLTERSLAKYPTGMLRFRSLEISIPYPWICKLSGSLHTKDIASVFSSNEKMRNSANLWTVALTRITCKEITHRPFLIRFVKAYWWLSLRTSLWATTAEKPTTLWNPLLYEVCLSSFCTGGNASGNKSIIKVYGPFPFRPARECPDDLYVFCSDLIQTRNY